MRTSPGPDCKRCRAGRSDSDHSHFGDAKFFRIPAETACTIGCRDRRTAAYQSYEIQGHTTWYSPEKRKLSKTVEPVKKMQKTAKKKTSRGKLHTADYLRKIGVPDIPPSISPFDPGYDPITVEGHLEQSGHLMSILKISMACWMVADEAATRRKIAAAKRHK